MYVFSMSEAYVFNLYENLVRLLHSSKSTSGVSVLISEQTWRVLSEDDSDARVQPNAQQESISGKGLLWQKASCCVAIS